GGPARLDEGARLRLHRPRVEAAPHAAVGLHALRHLEAEVARHERLGPRDGEVVQLVLPLAADFEGVREALGGEGAGARALAFDEGGGEQRRGVPPAGDLARLDAPLAQRGLYPGRHRARGIVVGGEHLAIHLAAGVVIVDHEVREGAADVDAERVVGHAGAYLSRRSSKGAEYEKPGMRPAPPSATRGPTPPMKASS